MNLWIQRCFNPKFNPYSFCPLALNKICELLYKLSR